MSLPPQDSDLGPLAYLRARDEILQVMYWMLGEGLGAQPTVAQLETFLGAGTLAVSRTLRRMTGDGYLLGVGDEAFELTALGLSEGKRSFVDEFAGLTNQAHGECSPDCSFCHSPEGDPSACPSKRVSQAAAG